MKDFDFGLDDLLDEGGGKRTAARWAGAGLGLVFFLLSSLTTAAFFYRFAPGLGFLFGPVIGPYVAAAVGVIALDLASLIWSFVRANGCNSEGQQTLALGVGVFDLVGALTVSGLYVLLAGGGLDAGVYDAAGGLTDFGHSLHLFGTIITTAALVVNFGAVWAFSALSAETKAAARQTALAATVTEGKYKVADAHARQTVQKSLLTIKDRMSDVTDEAAAANAARYSVMGRRPQAGLLEEGQVDSQPSSNGHGPNPTGGRR